MSDEDREKWDARYATPADAPESPSVHLVRLDDELPRQGRALDIAGGAGRHAIWLALRGLDVTLVDISPVGLELADKRAAELGVKLSLDCRDLEQEPLPPGPWDVIVSSRYLQRALWLKMRQTLSPGGWLVFLQPTVRNLERHERPPRGFLIEEGEARHVAEGLELIRYDEGWLDEGFHEAVVVARRPMTAFDS
jgi:2-polyprenyl-3-methyl-5-hydroxy-6-metoxy-1,4-benzoquinol methylase